eukprot:TRINITY_DN4230_c0_g1_i2.p3 TRINITY_DN4230_c0_g1~~TRINITY_DN4230_c0_g1_i2.p3  ORF type:complete len:147 (+),score=18.92 TRINITY_DN4230_c0_g1_i2:123-563(+)
MPRKKQGGDEESQEPLIEDSSGDQKPKRHPALGASIAIGFIILNAILAFVLGAMANVAYHVFGIWMFVVVAVVLALLQICGMCGYTRINWSRFCLVFDLNGDGEVNGEDLSYCQSHCCVVLFKCLPNIAAFIGGIVVVWLEFYQQQ